MVSHIFADGTIANAACRIVGVGRNLSYGTLGGADHPPACTHAGAIPFGGTVWGGTGEGVIAEPVEILHVHRASRGAGYLGIHLLSTIRPVRPVPS